MAVHAREVGMVETSAGGQDCLGDWDWTVLRMGYQHQPPAQVVDFEGRIFGPVRTSGGLGVRPGESAVGFRAAKIDLWPL